MLENILFSMNSTMPLFFIMLLGYVLHRTGFLSDAFVAGANKFVFYVALPVQLFRDLGKNDVRATFDGRYVLFCFAVTLACILVIWALAKLFLKEHRPCGRIRSGVLPLVGCHPRLGFSAEHLRRCQHVQPDDPWQCAAV